jgi:hypothetical protein
MLNRKQPFRETNYLVCGLARPSCGDVVVRPNVQTTIVAPWECRASHQQEPTSEQEFDGQVEHHHLALLNGPGV